MVLDKFLRLRTRGWCPRADLALALLLLALRPTTSALAHAPHDEAHAVALSPDFATDGYAVAALQLTEHRVIAVSWNGGATWRHFAAAASEAHVLRLAVSPAFSIDRTVAAGTEEGLFLSADAGVHWQAVGGAALDGRKVSGVAFSPNWAQDRTLLVATDRGVLRSADGGATWHRPAGLPAGPATEVAFAAAPGVVFAAAGNGLHRSTDSGKTFALAASFPYPLAVLAVDPSDASGQRLLAAYHGGPTAWVGWSQDGGQTFQPMHQGLTDRELRRARIAANGVCLALTAEKALFRAASLGAPWTLVDSGLEEPAPQTDDHHHDLAVSPAFATDGAAFLASHEGVHRYDDAAARFEPLDVYPQRILRLGAVSPAYAADGEVWFGDYGGGPFKLTTPADDWEALGHGVFSLWCGALALSPAYAQDATAYYGYAGLWRTQDGGTTWTKVAPGPPIVRAVALSPNYAQDRTLFANFAENGTALSTDGGLTWTAVPSLPKVRTDPIVLSPAFPSDRTLFAAPQMQGLWRSTDGGATWQDVSPLPAPLSIRSLALSPGYAHDRTLFAGTVGHGLWRSTDAGATWTPCTLPPGPGDGTIESLALSPAYPLDGFVYAVGWLRGLLRSTDGGLVFQSVGAGLPPDAKRVVLLPPTFPQDRTVFLTTHDWLWRSLDGGDHFERLPGAIRVDDKHPSVAHEGTWSQQFSALDFGNQVRVSNRAGDIERLQFEGSRVLWRARVGPALGLAEVRIDGAVAGTVDLYAPAVAHDQEVFAASLGPPAVHTIEIRVLGQRNPASSGVDVASDGFLVRF